MTLAERRVQVATLLAADRAARDQGDTLRKSGWTQKRQETSGGYRIVAGRPSGDAASVTKTQTNIGVQTLAPPWNLEWSFVNWEPAPGIVNWGIEWSQPAETMSWHLTVHRASDDAVVAEMCAGTGIGFPGDSGGAHWFDNGSTFTPGVGYYGKVAVSPNASGFDTEDWTCATDWSAEATSPVYVAIGGAPVLASNELLGCGYGNATGRPCFQAYRGDPVNTATGSLNESVVDAHMPAPGIDFKLTRNYSSASTVSVWLGPRWTNSYPLWLGFSAGTASFKAEDGSYAYFKDLGGGNWATDSKGAQSTLAGTAATGYTLTTHDQQKLRFDSVGWLTSWVDRSGAGLRFTYANNNLASVTDAAGRTHTFTFDATNTRLTRVTLADGRWIGYTYTSGRLSSVRDLNGGTTSYTYDASQRLATITDPAGRPVMRTVYDSSGRVSEQTDATGTTIRPDWGSSVTNFPDNRGGIWTDIYDGSVVVKQIDPYGKVTQFRYDFNSPNPTLKPIEITDPVGNKATMTYDTRGNLLTRKPSQSATFTESWTYDARNNITSYTDGRGAISRYVYDASGRLSTETDALGGVTRYTYTATGQVATVATPGGRTTRHAYDTAGNLIAETTPAGHKTTHTYDAGGRRLSTTDPRGNVAGANPATFTTSYGYDGAGHVTSVTDPAGNRTTYGYDANGNRTTVTDPAGRVTTYRYDAANRLTQVVNPAGKITTTTYDPAGNVTAVTDPTGAKTTHIYDAANRPIATTTPRGNAAGANPAQHTTTFGYDANGNQTSVTDPTAAVTRTSYDTLNRSVTKTDALGKITRYGYGNTGNLTSITDPTGAVTTFAFDANSRVTTSTNALGHATTYGYDADGLQTRQVSPTGGITTWAYDPDGGVTGMTEPRGNVSGANPADFTTTFAYDPAGNRTKVTDPLGRVVTTGYDPNNRVSSVADPAGAATIYQYDVAGNLFKVVTATGAATQYAYDSVGRLATLTNPRGKSYRYGYDDAGRIVSSTTPTGRVVRYAYTANGEPSTVTLPNGSVTYTYDAVDRVTKVDYSDTTPDLTYTYDAAGRTATAGNGTTLADYDYDNMGRITRIARGTQVFDYQWDAAGRPIKRTMPGGRSQSYAWTNDSRLSKTTLTTTAANRDINYGYDPAGNLTSVTRAGGPTTSYGYDRAGAIAQIAHQSGTTTLLQQNVAWSPQGNPATVTTTRGGTAVSSIYSYDAAGQVTGVCLPSTGTTCADTAPRISYEYGLSGNRTRTVNTKTNTTTVNTYDDDDRLTTRTVNGAVTTVTHDANGALASETGPGGTQTYTYGLDANLRTARLADGRTVGYNYDEAGNRTTRTINGTVDTSWTWDTVGMPTRVEEKNGAGVLTHQWWGDPQTDLGTALADTAAAPVWLLGDHQGSITDLASATALTGSATLEAFGEVISSSGAYAGNPLRFHGQYLDQLTSLYDMRARDYDPTSGRFTSPDPAPAAMGTPFTQTYHYGYNRPTVLTDPTGLCPIVCTAIIGGIAGAAVGGVDCWLSGDDRNTCIKKVAVGAAAGALTGATMGLAGGAGAGAYAGLTGAGVGATEFAGSLAIGGAGNVLYGSGVAAWTGQDYTYGDAGRDFLLGAGSTAGGGAAVTLAQRAAAKGASLKALTCPAAGAVGSATNRFATGVDEAVFWSGIRDGDKVAADWVAKNGGSTLETTMAARGIKLPAWDDSNPAVVSAWRNASRDFALGARGAVQVLQGDTVRSGSVWAQVEFPALIANPNVTSIVAVDPSTGSKVVLWTR